MRATHDVAGQLDGLETVLTLLVPALERLQAGQLHQREVIVQGELRPLLSVTAELDDIGRRVAALEGRRQAIQAELEAQLGVVGLRAVVAQADNARRARLLHLMDQIGAVVPHLREDGRRNGALLDSAVDMARRTRATLERLSGANSIYDPKKARQQARRALAARDSDARLAAGQSDARFADAPLAQTEAP